MKKASNIGMAIGVGVGFLAGISVFTVLVGALQVAMIGAVLAASVLGSVIGLSAGIIVYSAKDEMDAETKRPNMSINELDIDKWINKEHVHKLVDKNEEKIFSRDKAIEKKINLEAKDDKSGRQNIEKVSVINYKSKDSYNKGK